MYQIEIKKPYWEIESVDERQVIFSSRNSGLADFIGIPTNLVRHPESALKKGIIVKCDFKGHFVEILKEFDPNLSRHG